MAQAEAMRTVTRTRLYSYFPFLMAACAWGQEDTAAIDAAARAHHKIPRTIYGMFLEPIGNSTSGGLWPEIPTNPSFEENLWNAATMRRLLEQTPSLARAS